MIPLQIRKDHLIEMIKRSLNYFPKNDKEIEFRQREHLITVLDVTIEVKIREYEILLNDIQKYVSTYVANAYQFRNKNRPRGYTDKIRFVECEAFRADISDATMKYNKLNSLLEDTLFILNIADADWEMGRIFKLQINSLIASSTPIDFKLKNMIRWAEEINEELTAYNKTKLKDILKVPVGTYGPRPGFVDGMVRPSGSDGIEQYCSLTKTWNTLAYGLSPEAVSVLLDIYPVEPGMCPNVDPNDPHLQNACSEVPWPVISEPGMYFRSDVHHMENYNHCKDIPASDRDFFNIWASNPARDSLNFAVKLSDKILEGFKPGELHLLFAGGKSINSIAGQLGYPGPYHPLDNPLDYPLVGLEHTGDFKFKIVKQRGNKMKHLNINLLKEIATTPKSVEDDLSRLTVIDSPDRPDVSSVLLNRNASKLSEISTNIANVVEIARERVSDRVERIRELREIIEAETKILEDVQRASKYGNATSNYIPLLKCLGMFKIVSNEDLELTKIPEDWVPAEETKSKIPEDSQA